MKIRFIGIALGLVLLISGVAAATGGKLASPSANEHSLAAAESTWYDGERLRSYRLSLSEVAVLKNKESRLSAAQLLDAARSRVPGGELLHAGDALVMMRLPTRNAVDLLDDHTSLNPSASAVLSGVFYASAEDGERPFILTGEMIVHFHARTSPENVAAWADAYGVHLLGSLTGTDTYRFSCVGGEACLALTRQVYADPAVRYAYPNWIKPVSRRLLNEADLSLVKTVQPAAVSVGEEATFTITAKNLGPNLASLVQIADQLPAALELVSVSQSGGGSCLTRPSLSCRFSRLASGDEVSVTLVVRALESGTLVNTANVASALGSDPDASNNTASAALFVCSAGTPCADLSVVKTASPNPVVKGEELRYQIQVENAGPQTATGIEVVDDLDNSLTLISASVASGVCQTADSLVCSFPDLAPGASATLIVKVRPGTVGQVTNSASVSTTALDPNTANDLASVVVTVKEDNGGGTDPTLPDDPNFSQQWHLLNTGQGGGVPGEDMDAVDAWTLVKGSSAEVIAVVDEGVEIGHEDLAQNIIPGLSWDFVQGDANPTAGSHGTSVAGVAAAVGFNGIGVSGVAPMAGLVGLRLFDVSGGASDSDTAEALTHRYDVIDIYNNSWGPVDDGKRLEGPSPAVRDAIAEAIAEGRAGKGVIYCWAAGNGGDNDNSNYDGYANSRYAIAVSATTNSGVRAGYSEKGANILVNAPSSGGSLGITTTDRSGSAGYDSGEYTQSFGGTSSAAPAVCGAAALVLQANPSLSWRDVRYILAVTAEQNDPADAGWSLNGAGLPVNHKYGFGRVNAAAAVEQAQGWTPMTPAQMASVSVSESLEIPDNDPIGVSSSINFPSDLHIESVEVDVNIPHSYWGDLEIVLISPVGTRSVLFETHNSGATQGPSPWRVSSTRHLGESAQGVWRLEVKDLVAQDSGTLNSWNLTVHGVNAGSSSEAQADLSLQMSATPSPVTLGENLVYRLQIDNQGPETAVNLRLSNTLPSNVELVSVVAGSGGACSGSRVITCGLPSLAPAETFVVNVTVRPTETGNIANSAHVVSDNPDPVSGNNSDTEVVTVLPSNNVIHLLDVTVLGNGTVLSDPHGIDCPDNCSAPFLAGSDVVLEAKPALGHSFRGWSSFECERNAPICVVGMTQDKRIVAIFD